MPIELADWTASWQPTPDQRMFLPLSAVPSIRAPPPRMAKRPKLIPRLEICSGWWIELATPVHDAQWPRSWYISHHARNQNPRGYTISGGRRGDLYRSCDKPYDWLWCSGAVAGVDTGEEAAGRLRTDIAQPDNSSSTAKRQMFPLMT
jgi:hypothetical protein